MEIQVRSALQHLWAELSEKFSDVADPAIKYGGGKGGIRQLLDKTSAAVERLEEMEGRIAELRIKGADRTVLEGLQREYVSVQREIAGVFGEALSWLEKRKGRKE